MGFFSNKDKACPICGGATPRLMARKFEGQPICSACADNIAADDEMTDKWGIAELQEHMNYRDENLELVEDFTPTRTVDYDVEIIIDDDNELFYLNSPSTENPPIFSFDEIIGYQLKLGYHTVESWSKGTPRTPYRPPALGIVSGLSMLVSAFGGNNNKNEDTEFEDIKVILQLDTEYLHEFELCDFFVSGKGSAEFEHDFAREFAKADSICNLIVSLGNANTSAAKVSGSSAVSSANQAVDDIKKFKELLDAGVITREEFEAKKKQLLGI